MMAFKGPVLALILLASIDTVWIWAEASNAVPMTGTTTGPNYYREEGEGKD